MGKFEENWKEIFEGAEVSPSDSVWENIDHDLTIADGKSMKKRMVLYQRIAAASIFFALVAGSFGVYYWSDSNAKLIQQKSSEVKSKEGREKSGAQNQDLSNTPSQKEIAHETLNQKNVLSTNETSSVVGAIPLSNSENNPISSNSIFKDSIADKNIMSPIMKIESFTSTERNLNEIEMISFKKEEKFQYENRAIPGLDLLPIEELQGEPVMVELVRKLPAIPGAFMIITPSKIMHEKLWASVTASSGNYSSNANAYSNLNTYAYTTGIKGSTSSTSSAILGNSYSFGMLGGIRMSKRFVLQSGVQYINESNGSLSNINSAGSLAATANYAKTPTSTSYGTTSPYQIVSANEFVSIPVTVGYLFVNKKIGVQLNGGGATDFFIRNTLSDPTGRLQTYSQGSGQNSPYRSVDIAGLLNSEVSYKLGSRYRLSVVPGFRYSFNPILKSGSEYTATPWLWDIGFRFRYILK